MALFAVNMTRVVRLTERGYVEVEAPNALVAQELADEMEDDGLVEWTADDRETQDLSMKAVPIVPAKPAGYVQCGEFPSGAPNLETVTPCDDIDGTYRKAGLVGTLTPDEISRMVGFGPNVEQDEKVRFSWCFRVSGRRCAVWDYKGTRWSARQS